MDERSRALLELAEEIEAELIDRRGELADQRERLNQAANDLMTAILMLHHPPEPARSQDQHSRGWLPAPARIPTPHPGLIRDLEKSLDAFQNARQAIRDALNATRRGEVSAADAAIERAAKHVGTADLSEGG